MLIDERLKDLHDKEIIAALVKERSGDFCIIGDLPCEMYGGYSSGSKDVSIDMDDGMAITDNNVIISKEMLESPGFLSSLGNIETQTICESDDISISIPMPEDMLRIKVEAIESAIVQSELGSTSIIKDLENIKILMDNTGIGIDDLKKATEFNIRTSDAYELIDDYRTFGRDATIDELSKSIEDMHEYAGQPHIICKLADLDIINTHDYLSLCKEQGAEYGKKFNEHTNSRDTDISMDDYR